MRKPSREVQELNATIDRMREEISQLRAALHARPASETYSTAGPTTVRLHADGVDVGQLHEPEATADVDAPVRITGEVFGG